MAGPRAIPPFRDGHPRLHPLWSGTLGTTRQSDAAHKSVNGKTFKKRPAQRATRTGPCLPDAVEHVVVQHSYGETVWYDLAAYEAGTRLTWKTILEHFTGAPSVTKGARENIKGIPPAVMGDPVIAGLLQSIKNAQQKELDRISRLSPQERENSEADRRTRVAAWEAQERDRLENPRFGDFLIGEFVVRDSRQPGAWLFRDSVPGVIGVTEHLSMCLADKLEVPLPVLDAIAELSAINHVIAGVRVIWKPGAPTGPQYPAWSQHQHFARTVAAIVRQNANEIGRKRITTPAQRSTRARHSTKSKGA